MFIYNENQVTLHWISKTLYKCNYFLIITHVRPDGDTTGCAAALCKALRLIGKVAYVARNPSYDEKNPLTQFVSNYIAPYGYEPKFVITVDISDERRFPKNLSQYAGNIDLAIDHHGSFEFFGKYNYLVDEESACGMIFKDIIESLDDDVDYEDELITPEIATALYLAISSDTGCFRNPNTSSKALEYAKDLIDMYNADYQRVNKLFFRTKSKTRISLEAKAIQSAYYSADGKVCVMHLRYDDIEGASESDMEDIADTVSVIEGVECFAIARELVMNHWKISIRTEGDRYDANKICAKFGGGGHKHAGGCFIDEHNSIRLREELIKAIG